MHILYVGGVGSGKTICAVMDAIDDNGDFIYTNQPIDEQKMNDFLVPTVENEAVKSSRLISKILGYLRKPAKMPKKVFVWSDFKDETVRNAKCGVLLIDEAPLWLDARKWDSLDPDARRKIIEHRKDDLLIISTAQDVSFIDKVYRVLADEIRLLTPISMPFIGWIWPTCIRPTIYCEHCGRIRRDGFGDDATPLRRWLGFGTYFRWDVYSPKDLMLVQDARGYDLPEEKIQAHGRRLFNIEKAACYDTHKKLSSEAASALAARRNSVVNRQHRRYNKYCDEPTHILNNGASVQFPPVDKLSY